MWLPVEGGFAKFYEDAPYFSASSCGGANYVATVEYLDAKDDSAEMNVARGDLLAISKLETGWTNARKIDHKGAQVAEGWVPT